MDLFIRYGSTEINIGDVPRAFAKARIPVHKWHDGALEDFFKMLSKEAVTLHLENGQLVLHIMVAVPYIGYVGENLQELYEAYQLRMDGSHPGRVHFKSRPFDGSLGETLLKYWDGRIENGQAAIERGLLEELGWCDSSLYELSTWEGSTWETSPRPMPSDKYPGLMDIYHRYRMHCIISDELYDPKGYVNLDTTKLRKEIFLWKNI